MMMLPSNSGPTSFERRLKTLDDGQKLPSIVEVHLVEVRRMKKSFPECKERKLAWMRPDDAALVVDEPELKSLIRSLNRHRAFF